jgi:hypothetical protein
MKGCCAVPIAEFHPARAGPSELKPSAANPNRSSRLAYPGVSTADQNLTLPEVANRSRMR